MDRRTDAGDRRSGTPRMWRALPAVAWACVIFAASSLPAAAVPGRFSLAGHLAEYAVFGALVLFAVTGSRPEERTAFLALALCAAYAITDEFHQAFVPGRTPDPLDWSADTLGSALGIAAGLLAARWRASRRAS